MLTIFNVYKYRICIADFVLSSSAASLISLADYTSAFADMILLSPNLRSFAALDNDSCSSLLNWMSLIKIYYIYDRLYSYIYAPLFNVLVDLFLDIVRDLLSFFK